MCSTFGKDLFFGLHLKLVKKSVPFLVKTFFFFWSSFNLLTRTKSWSRFIPPLLKIGQNWGKVANYIPQCSTKIDSPVDFFNWLSNLKNLVISNGCKNLRNIIQMVFKWLFFPRKITKNRPAAGPYTPVCNTFGLNKFAHHVSQLRHFGNFFNFWFKSFLFCKI